MATTTTGRRKKWKEVKGEGEGKGALSKGERSRARNDPSLRDDKPPALIYEGTRRDSAGIEESVVAANDGDYDDHVDGHVDDDDKDDDNDTPTTFVRYAVRLIKADKSRVKRSDNIADTDAREGARKEREGAAGGAAGGGGRGGGGKRRWRGGAEVSECPAEAARGGEVVGGSRKGRWAQIVGAWASGGAAGGGRRRRRGA